MGEEEGEEVKRSRVQQGGLRFVVPGAAHRAPSAQTIDASLERASETRAAEVATARLSCETLLFVHSHLAVSSSWPTAGFI